MFSPINSQDKVIILTCKIHHQLLENALKENKRMKSATVEIA